MYLPAPVAPRPEAVPTDRVATVALPGDGSSATYLKLRNQVVAWGTDALPAAATNANPPEPIDIRWKPARGDI